MKQNLASIERYFRRQVIYKTKHFSENSVSGLQKRYDIDIPGTSISRLYIVKNAASAALLLLDKESTSTWKLLRSGATCFRASYKNEGHHINWMHIDNSFPSLHKLSVPKNLTYIWSFWFSYQQMENHLNAPRCETTADKHKSINISADGNELGWMDRL